MWHCAKTAVWSLGVFATFVLGLLADNANPTAAMAAAMVTVALVVAVAVALGTAVAVPVTHTGPVFGDRLERVAVIDQCDPDAAGRPRPRAPGRHLHR